MAQFTWDMARRLSRFCESGKAQEAWQIKRNEKDESFFCPEGVHKVVLKILYALYAPCAVALEWLWLEVAMIR